MIKAFGAVSSFIERDKPQETTYRVPQAILTFTVDLIRAFSRT